MAHLLNILVLLCVFSAAFAIKCYECDSSKNMACNIGLLSFVQPAVDCDEKSSQSIGFLGSIIPKNCFKITAKDRDNNEYTARGCGVNVGFNACDVVAKTVGFMASQDGVHDLACSVCDSDKCNGASALGTTVLLGVLAACFLFLF